MTMIRDEEGHATGEAQCDAPGCEVMAPAPGDWLKANPGKRWPGWNSLDWWCCGGRHYCPTHNPSEVDG